jgi:quinol monooxygenase YgiN
LDTAITKIVRYRVKKKKLPKVKKTLVDFVAEIKTNEAGIDFYEVFQEKNDPTVFVHVMTFKDKKAERAHAKSTHVQKLIKTLYPTCKEEPEFTDLKLVKSIKGSENKSTPVTGEAQESQQ